MKNVTQPDSGISLYVDISTDFVSRYFPYQHSQQVFFQLHGFSHPGIRASQQLIASRFIWEGINKDVRLWTRTCIKCQSSKVTQHTRSPAATFTPVSERFHHIHLDLVRPLPLSNGCRYILTCVDRFTRWPEPAPIADITANSVARAFTATWNSRFGVPHSITSDSGSQFESTVWSKLMSLLGCRCYRTSRYHPQAKGTIERFHRQLKASLTAAGQREHWSLALPNLTSPNLRGIRTSLKMDLHCSSADLVYGTALRLPGEPLVPAPNAAPCTAQDIAALLRRTMSVLQLVQPRSLHRKTFVHQNLDKCTHVFFRVDGVRKPLHPPYQGPFEVIRRTRKTVAIDHNGIPDSVAVDHVKLAHLLHSISPTVPPSTASSTGATKTQQKRRF